MSNVVGLITSAKKEPASGSGPPFALNSADNGLSVDHITGHIVFGDSVGFGGPAQLLSQRELELNGFLLQFHDTAMANTRYVIGGGVFEVDENSGGVGAQIAIGAAGDQALLQMISINGQSNRIFFHNDNVPAYDTAIDAQSGQLIFGSIALAMPVLNLDIVGQEYAIGDYIGVLNGTALIIRDPLQTVTLGDTLLFNSTLTLDAANQFSQVDLGGSPFLGLDRINKVYEIGDFTTADNGTALVIDDAAQDVRVNFTAAFPQLRLGTNGFDLGDVNAGFGGMTFFGNAAAGEFGMNTVNGLLFDFNESADSYQMGDLAGTNSSIQLFLQGSTNTVIIDNAAHNLKIKMNNVNGFTGTVGPIITSITVNGGIVTNVT